MCFTIAVVSIACALHAPLAPIYALQALLWPLSGCDNLKAAHEHPPEVKRQRSTKRSQSPHIARWCSRVWLPLIVWVSTACTCILHAQALPGQGQTSYTGRQWTLGLSSPGCYPSPRHALHIARHARLGTHSLEPACQSSSKKHIYMISGAAPWTEPQLYQPKPLTATPWGINGADRLAKIVPISTAPTRWLAPAVNVMHSPGGCGTYTVSIVRAILALPVERWDPWAAAAARSKHLAAGTTGSGESPSSTSFTPQRPAEQQQQHGRQTRPHRLCCKHGVASEGLAFHRLPLGLAQPGDERQTSL